MKISKNTKKDTLEFSDYKQHFIMVRDYLIIDLPRFYKKPRFQRNKQPNHLRKIIKSIVAKTMPNNIYWFWMDKHGNLKSIDGQHRFDSYLYLNSLDEHAWRLITFQAVIIEGSEKKAIEVYRNLHRGKKHTFSDELKIFDTGKEKFFNMLRGVCDNQPYNSFYNFRYAFNLIMAVKSYHENNILIPRETRAKIPKIDVNLESIKKADIDRLMIFLGALKEFSLKDNFKNKTLLFYIYVIFEYNDFSYKKSKLSLSKLKNNNKLYSFIEKRGINDESSKELLDLIESSIKN